MQTTAEVQMTPEVRMSADAPVLQIAVTAGQAGQGKSTLIQALTGASAALAAADALAGTRAVRGAAERTGAANDLGFDWVELPSGRRLAFADAPAHERFITSLLAGAGESPIALFVVAADEGWQPQSAAHLDVLDALGVRRGLLVVTKSDLADPAVAAGQAAAGLAGTSLAGLRTVAVSAATGTGLAELVAALDELTCDAARADPGAAVRIWVDRAVSTYGDGAIVTGTLPAGTVDVGDELVVTPSMRPVRVHDLQSLGEPAESASGIARLALSLRGAGREALHRGMALIQPGRWALTDLIDVRLTPAAGPVSRAGQADGPRADSLLTVPTARGVTVHIGSARLAARVRPLGQGLARLSLSDPVPLHVGDRLVLCESGARRGSSAAATAGAIVLDASPPPLTRRGAVAAAARQLAGWRDRPGAAELLARHGIMRASALLAMGITDHPAPVAGEWLADPERWRSLSHQLGELLTGQAASADAGVPIDAAQAALDLPDRRLVLALARPPFRVWGGALHITRAAGEESSRDLPEQVLAAVRVLRADLAAAPFASPDADRLRKLGLDARGIAAAVRAGELLRVSDQVVLAPGADAAAARVLAKLEQPFTAAQARQVLATTRRTAIPLLEYLDSAGITERLPDDRRVLRAQLVSDAPHGTGPPAAAGSPAASGTCDSPARSGPEAPDPAIAPAQDPPAVPRPSGPRTALLTMPAPPPEARLQQSSAPAPRR